VEVEELRDTASGLLGTRHGRVKGGPVGRFGSGWRNFNFNFSFFIIFLEGKKRGERGN
jgi:hypothetical protein